MKKNTLYCMLIILGLIVFLISSCSKDNVTPDPDSGKIKTDQSVFVGKKTIPVSGGQFDINGTTTPIEGLSILVPNNAYTTEKEFSVSYANITSHSLGQYFNPISPLIEISNGGDYADKLITLKIPVSSNPGYYRMVCYYDKVKGTVEGISIVKSDDQYIEVAVRHFSLIVITEVQKDILIKGGGFHTDFDPNVNGWSFMNFGTYPEPKGICAGMSIGAAYHFKNFKALLNLNSYFENDQLWFRTSDFWEDDAKGLRFATAIHRTHSIFWDNGNTSITQMISSPEEDRFWNLIYAILIENQPQLIYLSSTKTDTAHMMIGFAYTINASNATISVYDPNFSGLTKTIEYDLITKKFKPYISAANATAVEQGYFNLYDKIAFVPLSTVMSNDEMNFLWQKVQNNTIGEGIFPPYKIFAVPKNTDFKKVELNTTDKTIQNYIPFDEFDFEVEGFDPSYKVTKEAVSFYPGAGLERINPAQTIKMENTDTLIGLHLKALPPNESYERWLGFNWFKISLQDIWIEPNDTIIAVNSELTLVARHNGTAPKHAQFEWDFGDKTDDQSTDSSITHKYVESGDYEVTLTVINLDNQKEVAKVYSKVNVTVWPRIAITIKGMDTNPPSTIKASDDSDIPSISWANKYVSTAPAISWNKNDFTIDFQYNLSPAVYTCSIRGTMSDDGKKINYLSAIYTGLAFEGDWTYQAAIVLQNFPIEEYLPGKIIGKSLTGPEAQSKVAQLSWKQTFKDNQGVPTEKTLKSVDWTSNKTELSVYFYDR